MERKIRLITLSEYLDEWLPCLRIRVWLEVKRNSYGAVYRVPPNMEPAWDILNRRLEFTRDELATELLHRGKVGRPLNA